MPESCKGGGRQLAAFVVLKDRSTQRDFSIAEVKRFCRQSLPDFMIPTSYKVLSELPLTPNNKIDHRALAQVGDLAIGDEDDYDAPTSELEVKIHNIWTTILGASRISINDNYFNIGGNSLLAIKLINTLNTQLQTQIPARQIFLEPTIKGLAALVASGSSVANLRILFTINRGRQDLTPLFLLPGAYDRLSRQEGYENDIMRYFANLFVHLRKDQPIYGLRAIGIYHSEEPIVSAQQVAKLYVAEIKKVRPHGPYFIAGECVGGIIAYEIAQQLEEQNEEVAFLGLLDTFCPTTAFAINDFLYFLYLRLSNLKNGIKAIFKRPLKATLTLYKTNITHFIKGIRHLNLAGIGDLIKRADYYYIAVLLRYRPKAYGGKVTLIANECYCRHNPYLNWQRISIGDLERHVVPGDHMTRLSQYGKELGKTLQVCIDRAEAQIKPSHKKRAG